MKNISIDKEQEILTEARSRLNWCATTESFNRAEAIDDLKFKVNIGHWPARLKKKRENAGKPCEVINLIPGQIDLILGEIRQNKISVKVLPTGKPASVEIADIIEGIIRNIEAQSSADIALQTAAEGMVDCGRGVLRIVEEYCDDDVFNKRLRIKRMKNQFSAYFDPAAEEWDKRDGRFAFVLEEISEDEYRARYPGKEPSNWPMSGIGDKLKRWWYGEKTIRIAEYWVREPRDKTYLLLSDGRVVLKEDWEKVVDDLKKKEQVVYKDENDVLQYVDTIEEVPAQYQEQMTILNQVPTIKSEHTVPGHDVMMYLMDGAQILSGPHRWKGRYIPLVLMSGKETHIEGKDYIRGQIRNAKGPQRIYNYERNAEIERVAMAKVPTIAMTPEQIQDQEESWSGEANHKVGLYNFVAGQPAPIQLNPPQASSGNVQQALAAVDDVKSTTGIFDATRGAKSNETSGVAINARKTQGNIANFAYSDNMARAAKYMYEILADMIPRVYTKERQEMILGKDGSEKVVMINETVVDAASGEEVILNDMTIGKYAVTISVGPQYQTQRQEFADKSIQLARFVPIIGQVGADLLVKNLDFHDADELAERIRKTLPPQLVGDEDTEQQEPQPSADDIKAQLEIERKKLEIDGKNLDIQEKQMDLNNKSGDIQNLIESVTMAATQAILQKMGITPQAEKR